jgi:phosphate-selective porin
MLIEILATVSIATRLDLSATWPIDPALGGPVFLQDAASPRDRREAGADEEGPEAPDGFVWDDGPSLKFENLQVDFEARFQEDIRGAYKGANRSAGLSTFELQRSRVGIQGSLFTHIEFEVERELHEDDLTAAELAEGLTPKSPWKDVNINIDYSRRVQVRAGRFKIPFGLDELTAIHQNDFVYRSLGADYLAPSRDVGVMAHGRFLDRALSYWAGAFRHDGDNARSKKIRGGNRTFGVRLTGVPLRWFRSAAGGPEVGVAFATSDVSDDSFLPNGLRGRTILTDDTFFSAVYVKGRRHRWEGDLEWQVGRTLLRAEFTQVTDDRLGQGFRFEDLPDARYRAWYLAATYVVTGEDKSRPLRPRKPFLQGGLGAFEVAGRIERMWCDSVGGQDQPFRNPRAERILPSGDRALTIGVNWILNRWVRLQVNGIREQIQDAERSPVPNGTAFWSRVVRLQFVL